MSVTRNPIKFRDNDAHQRQPRRSARRQSTRSAIIAAALLEG